MSLSPNASPYTLHLIATMCMALHISEPLEERKMSQWEAYKTVQWLSAQLAKARKGGKSGR